MAQPTTVAQEWKYVEVPGGRYLGVGAGFENPPPQMFEIKSDAAAKGSFKEVTPASTATPKAEISSPDIKYSESAISTPVASASVNSAIQRGVEAAGGVPGSYGSGPIMVSDVLSRIQSRRCKRHPSLCSGGSQYGALGYVSPPVVPGSLLPTDQNIRVPKEDIYSPRSRLQTNNRFINPRAGRY